MLFLAVIVVVAFLTAALSAFSAYKLSGSNAWQRAYNDHRIGLIIELVTIFLLFCAVISVAMAMREAFTTLFFSNGWKSPWFLGGLLFFGTGVIVYMNFFAPGILAKEQHVEPMHLSKECRLPYLLYTPYSLVTWVALILPLIAMVCISIQLDHSLLNALPSELDEFSLEILAMADRPATFDANRLDLYLLEYDENVYMVQSVVNRYLWVVGTFMVFLILMLNTKIATVFTEEAQDSFKWVMWILLLVATGISFYGLIYFQLNRSASMEFTSALYARMKEANASEHMLAAKAAFSTLQEAGTTSFVRRILDGGGLWLLFFSYGSQIVLAKMTRRSVLKVIFPRYIATFLDNFVHADEEP